MDFITGLPRSEGRDAIFVVVDRLTKYAHFRGTQTGAKASQIAELYMKEIHRLHGFPKVIISDRDPKFTSHFWKELFKSVGTSLHMSTAYHPQTDGQTEIVNKCVEGYLRNFASDKQTQWHRWLHLAEWWYNTTYHAAAKMSPFQALYGYEPPSLLNWLNTSKVQTVQENLQQMQETIRILKNNLEMAKNRMKQQADRKRSERSFEIGEWVFLRLQPYKQMSMKQNNRHKLSPRFFGPYQIEERIGEVAYQLKLPLESKIHNIFHVSCLKKKLGEKEAPQTNLPTLDEEGIMVVEPEGILKTRDKNLRSRIIKEYLIKWKTLDLEDATWESEEWMQKNGPLPML